MLRIIQRPETDPYFNLAAEEFLLKTSTVNTFMIWRNEPSVIVGKHQNTSREINHSYVDSRNLPVIRRISGGGTVYHDLGNVNFSFIFTDRKENLIDFRQFTKPVINFLESLGLDATFEGKNNITASGLKVSGNSAHIHRNKVLYHGTLLFSTDLTALRQAISGQENRYTDKSVNSVRADMVNISSLLVKKMTVEEFINLFESFILDLYPGSYHDSVSGRDQQAIRELAEKKYKDPVWNYGYSPEYKFYESWNNKDGNFHIELVVKNGVIRHCEIQGPENYARFLKETAERLTDVLHEKKSFSERLKKLTFADESHEKLVNQLMDHLF